MKYICQLDYKHIPYETNLDNGGNPVERRSISSSGCGVCSVCMVVDLLTDKTFSIEECRDLSYETGANRPHSGTKLALLGPAAAERFNLVYESSTELSDAIDCLRAGGKVIAHVKAGLFTARSHYICLISTDGKEFCILDPSYTPTKFHTPEREGRVDDSEAPYVYCDVDVLHLETEDNHVKYHLFRRKDKCERTAEK